MNIVVDTSVWIDYFRDADLPHVAALDNLLTTHQVVVPSIVLLEVLRGVRNEGDASALEEEFGAFECVDICSPGTAIKAARNYRRLRAHAITVRSSVDLMIGTWCIESGVWLLHNDRDFDGMERYLGLKCWPDNS